MSAALPIFYVFSRQQPGNIFCLNDQTHIACFMCFKRCVTSIFISYHLKFNYSQYTMYKRLKNWMIGCNTHLLKHMKQAILVWSFRQNIFPGCYRQKTSKYGRAVDIVGPPCATIYAAESPVRAIVTQQRCHTTHPHIPGSKPGHWTRPGSSAVVCFIHNISVRL